MRARVGLVVSVVAMLLAIGGAPASAAQVSFPREAAPSWMTDSVRAQIDAAGTRGVSIAQLAAQQGPSALDVCPGAVIFHEGGVGTGTCLVYPYGCTANFIYQEFGGTAPAVADGHQYLGSAGHCSDHAGQPVYGAISTPGVGPAIAKIGEVSKRTEQYKGSRVYDFEAIHIDPGYKLYPASPVGGPHGVYDGCETGTPLKYYGHGYEVAVSQGKPEGGISAHWFDDGYGWAGPAFGGDSGSGVLTSSNLAAGDLTATAIILPPYAPGETIGARMTWILQFSGMWLVNDDSTTARDTTSSCGTSQTAAKKKPKSRSGKRTRRRRAARASPLRRGDAYAAAPTATGSAD